MARAVKGGKDIRSLPVGARGPVRSMLSMTDEQLEEFSHTTKKGKA